MNHTLSLFRSAVGRCLWHAFLFTLALWLLVAVCILILFAESPGPPHHGIGAVLGIAIFGATGALVLALPPFLFSQSMVAGLFALSIARTFIQSCALMVIGTIAATAVMLATFWLILRIPFMKIYSLFPLSSIIFVTGLPLSRHWILSGLAVQSLLAAFSWWQLRHRPDVA